MAKTQEIVKPNLDLINRLAGQAQQEAAALEGSSRVQFARLRIDSIKSKSGTKSVVEVANPFERDDQDNPKITQFDSVDAVLLAHVMTRRVRYQTLVDGKPRMVTELFSVGPKRGAWAVGSAIGGALPWDGVVRRYPDGFDRLHIPYGTDQATKGYVKPASRYYAVVGLSGEAREAAGADVAFIGLSMTSAYGIQIKDANDADEMGFTLLGFPQSRDANAAKGVLHVLKTRPWQLGLAAGLDEETGGKTPQHAIWLRIFGANIGESTMPVHGFEIGDELTPAELAWVTDEAEPQAIELMKAIIAQETRDAYPSFVEAQLARLADAALANDSDAVSQAVRLGAPQAVEVVDDDEEVPAGEDLGSASVVQNVADEFPDESELPF